jgi:hypothetical protein
VDTNKDRRWTLFSWECDWANGENASPQWWSDLASHRGAPSWILLSAMSGTRWAISTSRSLRGWTCRALVRAAPLRRQPIWDVGLHFRRVVWVENVLSGCRTTRQTGISISQCFPLELYLTHLLFVWEITWITMLQGCLNISGAYWCCDRYVTSFTTLWRYYSRPLPCFYLVGQQRKENGRTSYTADSERSLQEGTSPTFSPGTLR